MKLNKFLLSLLIVPALTFMSCNDYEDIEVVSPQADANALGANFSAAATSVVINPTTDKFELTLNRVNTKEATTVPVTIVKCDIVTDGVKFCDQPTAFLFAAGEAQSTIELKINPGCKFQKTYTMTLSIGAEKDHPYAAGTASTKVSVIRDYKWVSLGKPVILESGWYKAGILATVQWAKDYEDADKSKLCRIKALYSGAKIAADVPLDKDKEGKPIQPNPPYAPAAAGDLQFLLDGNYAPVGMFVTDGYDPSVINTGILQNEKTGNYFFMNVSDVTKDANSKYSFRYAVTYKGGETSRDVVSDLDFDIKTPVEKLIKDSAK